MAAVAGPGLVRPPRVRAKAAQEGPRPHLAELPPNDVRGSTPVVYRLTRVFRTECSEIYLVWDGDSRIAQADLHYGPDLIHGTVVLERDFTEAEVDDLLKQLDRDVVSSYLQDFERENFFVSVFRGDEILTTSDEDLEDVEPEDDAW